MRSSIDAEVQLAHFGLNLLFPALLAYGGWKLGKRSPRAGLGGAIVLCLLLLVRALLLRAPELEITLFPWRDYAFYSGWQYGLFPALALCVLPSVSPRNARALCLGAVGLFAFHAMQISWMLAGQELELEERRSAEGDCLQSTAFSCGAASAVNLLARHGIDATETEMARASLLREGRGSNEIGVLRGLAIRCESTSWEPVLRALDYEDLVRLRRPALVPLRVSWLANHLVCVLEARPAEILLLDPASGRITLPRNEFEERFVERAIYLRASGAPDPLASSLVAQ
ncbi:MAG: hypothetical protein JNM84_23490 [Planctomycetes bacterium]|nr:hypothetical protein [Planctomycetota bacterium]